MKTGDAERFEICCDMSVRLNRYVKRNNDTVSGSTEEIIYWFSSNSCRNFIIIRTLSTQIDIQIDTQTQHQLVRLSTSFFKPTVTTEGAFLSETILGAAPIISAPNLYAFSTVGFLYVFQKWCASLAADCAACMCGTSEIVTFADPSPNLCEFVRL